MLPTPRLTLKLFSEEDARDLFTIRGDPEAMRFWDWPGDVTIGQTEQAARQMAAETRSGEAFYLTARLRDGTFVGVFDLSELRAPHADLGFMVTRRLWGCGYATEGARALVEEARRRGLASLKARVHLGNDASRRLLVALGFRAIGAPAPVEVAPGRVVLCERFRLELYP